MRSLIAVMLAVATPMPALAAPTLWRTLEAGDAPEVVKAKLEAMAEVKRVKMVQKKGQFSKLDINMNEGGVPIFDGHFDIETTFKDAKLATVKLTSGAGCLNDAYPFAVKVSGELEKKYPEVEVPLVDDTTFSLRALEATNTYAATTTSGYLNSEVGALFQAIFVRVDPPVYYGGSALNRSLYHLARSTYDLGSQKCGGPYYRTAQFSVTYLSRADWSATKAAVEREAEAERKKAGENL